MLKKALVITAVILGVGASAPAFASDLLNTFNGSYGSPSPSTWAEIVNGDQYRNVWVANTSGYVSVVDWDINLTSGTASSSLSIYKNDVLQVTCTTPTFVDNSIYDRLQFACGHSIVSGATYRYEVTKTSVGTYYIRAGQYTQYADNNPQGWYLDTTWKRFYETTGNERHYSLDFRLESGTPPGPTLTWTYPTASASLGGDFTDWRYQLTTGSGFVGREGVRYGTTTAMTDWGDSFTQNSVAGTLPNTSWGVYMKKSNLLAPGTYYAQVYIQNASSTDIATSEMISFTVGSGSITYNGSNAVDMPTSTSTDLIITCDPNSGFFTNSLCNMTVYLFKPSSGVFDTWSGLWTVISAKPPMGYFTKTKEALEGINTATSSAFTFEDVSALDDNIFTPLRTGVAFLLWFMFGIWLFNRLRHFNF